MVSVARAATHIVASERRLNVGRVILVQPADDPLEQLHPLRLLLLRHPVAAVEGLQLRAAV